MDSWAHQFSTTWFKAICTAMSYINNSLDIDELYDLHIRIFFEEMRCECKEKKYCEKNECENH